MKARMARKIIGYHNPELWHRNRHRRSTVKRAAATIFKTKRYRVWLARHIVAKFADRSMCKCPDGTYAFVENELIRMEDKV